jgi:hypothetical protein
MILKFCCNSGVDKLPKLNEILHELKFCPWCGTSISFEPTVEVFTFNRIEGEYRVAVTIRLNPRDSCTFYQDESLERSECELRVRLLNDAIQAAPRQLTPSVVRTEIEAEAALILEQEGWMIARASHEQPSYNRLKRFAERYTNWMKTVGDYRARNPESWPTPPDNS